MALNSGILVVSRTGASTGLDHRLVRSGQADQEGSKLSESSQPDVRSDGQDRPPGGQNDDQGPSTAEEGSKST